MRARPNSLFLGWIRFRYPGPAAPSRRSGTRAHLPPPPLPSGSAPGRRNGPRSRLQRPTDYPPKRHRVRATGASAAKSGGRGRRPQSGAPWMARRHPARPAPPHGSRPHPGPRCPPAFKKIQRPVSQTEWHAPPPGPHRAQHGGQSTDGSGGLISVNLAGNADPGEDARKKNQTLRAFWGAAPPNQRHLVGRGAPLVLPAREFM